MLERLTARAVATMRIDLTPMNCGSGGVELNWFFFVVIFCVSRLAKLLNFQRCFEFVSGAFPLSAIFFTITLEISYFRLVVV